MADQQQQRPGRAAAGLERALRGAASTYWTLLKVMVPVIILTKALEEIGAVKVFGRALGPVMGIVGLPGEMGLVWAAAMLVNIYAAMIVFATIAPGLDLTVAQVTVLCTMMLLAHGLPVELRIAQKAGPRIRAIGPLRVAGALLLGWILDRIYTLGAFLQMPARPVFTSPPADPSLLAWAGGQARNLLMIFGILLALFLLMQILKAVGITRLLTRLLEPVLRLLGISHEAAPVAIVGMTLGLTYGGGLIINESRSGRVGPRDVFFSLALMALCHSLIEDTLLMAALGAHVSGIFFGRLIFSLFVVFVLVRTLGRLPDDKFERLLVRPRAEPRADGRPEGA
jgi:hypothetical protein